MDRDGVVNKLRSDYVRSADQLHFVPRSLAALKMLKRCKVSAHIATNQSVVGRGLITNDELGIIHKKFCEAISTAGGAIESIEVCTHAPEQRCNCRKPHPELLTNICRKFNLHPSEAIFVGDSHSDYFAAKNCGMQFCGVLTGNITHEDAAKLQDAMIFNDLFDCVKYLVKH